MRIAFFALVSSCVTASIQNTSSSRIGRSANEDSFEEKLGKARQLLNNEPDADDTKNLIGKLHEMEKNLKDKFTVMQNRDVALIDKMKEYAKNKTDHIQPKGDSIEEVNENSQISTTLFQGDILLTREQAQGILESFKNDDNRNKRQAYIDRLYNRETRWRGKVSYSFLTRDPTVIRVFQKAVNVWTTDTCLAFEQNDAGVGCWSHIGRIGGVQSISLGSGCESVGTAVHEIGHALGLFHTQSRHDRDAFVALFLQNIRSGWLSQVLRQTEYTNYNYELPYDYGSVMHYGARSASWNGLPYMLPRDLNHFYTMGSPMLSFYDKLMVNLHYGCLNACASTPIVCANGGFAHPRNCFTCICPSGFGGPYCNQKPGGCGDIREATATFQSLTDTVGPYNPYDTNDEFYYCYYWIQAPIGYKIEVILGSYSPGVAVDGCKFAGVEIKTGMDLRQTGYRFCSPESAGTVLLSTHHIVPIITYSRTRLTTTTLYYRLRI